MTELRKLGLLVGGVFLAVGAVLVLTGSRRAGPVLAAVGLALVVLAAVAPGLLAPVERGWTAGRLRQAGIRNAPGLVTAWLREPTPASVRRHEDGDPIAAQRQRFLGGPIGWVVRS